uniref:J domain-containing protein n=1 Tax=Eutreptiella gymnastica TaxID=73025 RepID=A0A7S1IH57_9EUGL
MDIDENPYTVLGVPQDASIEDIKKVYRKVVLTKHPDRRPEEQKEAAEKEFIQLQRAYELLADEDARKAYDNLASSKFRARAFKSNRDREMDAKRKKMASDLEEKERAAMERRHGVSPESEVEMARERLKAELERLRRKREQEQLDRRMAARDQKLQESLSPNGSMHALRQIYGARPVAGAVSADTVKRKEEDVFAKLRAKALAKKAAEADSGNATKRLHSEM